MGPVPRDMRAGVLEMVVGAGERMCGGGRGTGEKKSRAVSHTFIYVRTLRPLRRPVHGAPRLDALRQTTQREDKEAREMRR